MTKEEELRVKLILLALNIKNLKLIITSLKTDLDYFTFPIAKVSDSQVLETVKEHLLIELQDKEEMLESIEICSKALKIQLRNREKCPKS